MASGQGPYKEAKERLSQVLLNHSAELDGLECPFVWDFFCHFDAIDFGLYGNSHSNDDDTDLAERFDWIFTRISKQYFGMGVLRSLTTVTSLITDLKSRTEPIHGSTEFTNAILYIAQSCGVVLNLLNEDNISAQILKGSMTKLESTIEIGHLNGIRGMIYLNLNESLDHDLEATERPFLDDAIAATNRHFEYVYAKAKLIARKRKFAFFNERDVSTEEIELLAEVAAVHTFAVPTLLRSLLAAIDISKINGVARPDLSSQLGNVLEDAWNNRHWSNFGVPGLTTLAIVFVKTKKFDKAKEFFEMALSKEPNKVNLTLMHHYGMFLIRNLKSDLKKGFEYLAEAGHPTAFADLILLLKENPTFEGRESLFFYLEQFISCNKKISYKRLFTYIAYKHALVQDDVMLSVDYLKKAIMFDTDNLEFMFNSYFKKVAYNNIKAVTGLEFLPEKLDLSHDVAFMSDPKQRFNLHNALPSKPVTKLTSWWKLSGLKPVGEYEGYKRYQGKQRDRTRNTSSFGETTWRSHHPHSQGQHQASSNMASSDSSNWRQDCRNYKND